jgi:hypothetical protein
MIHRDLSVDEADARIECGQLLARLFGECCVPDAPLDSVDSLALLEFVAEADRRGVYFNHDLLSALGTVEDLCDYYVVLRTQHGSPIRQHLGYR